MNRIGVVALNTFREAVRDRVLYNLVFFALLMIAAAILVGQISIGIEQIVIVSLGLSAISVIGLLIAVFIGVGMVSKEIDKRTLYALLAKPVRRWEFVVGKFGGLLLTLTVNTAAMAAALRWLSYVLPNFEIFDVMGAAAHGRAIPRALVLQNTVYTVLYCAIVLAATSVIFTRRNLK